MNRKRNNGNGLHIQNPPIHPRTGSRARNGRARLCGAEWDIQRIERGELVYFVARVRVLLDGRELASDYLGGCCYESAGSFRQDPYFYDMVRSAIKDARAALRNIPRLRAA